MKNKFKTLMLLAISVFIFNFNDLSMIKADVSIPQNITLSTYEVLRNYNVLSFGDVTGIHIVGPIIAQNDAYRIDQINYKTGEFVKGSQGFSFSDYQENTSSYIKGYIQKGTAPNNGYSGPLGIDLPDQYVGTINNLKDEGGHTHVNGFAYLYNTIDKNNAQVYKTDNYIDFEKQYQISVADSNRIYKNSDYRIAPEDILENGTIMIETGDKILIPSQLTDQVKGICIKTNNLFDTDKITSISYESTEEVHIPVLYQTSDKNGVCEVIKNPGEFNNEKENEYNQSLNLIFNFPFAKKVVALNDRGEGIGHMIAPNADFYSLSGNYSGTLIVGNLYSTSEGHMWSIKKGLDPVNPEETPETPGEETPETPDEETPETPGEETPETPGEETPETPGEETPETPDEETPETPGEETPETPGEETPVTPDEETPETPDEETPETPGEETPETPDEETPETPDEETPETPGEETPVTPDEETPETPDEQIPVDNDHHENDGNKIPNTSVVSNYQKNLIILLIGLLMMLYQVIITFSKKDE